MDRFHERLATIGLGAGDRYGLALAGGYAIQANGMLERPSEDIDLFTTMIPGAEFEALVTAVKDAYTAAGLDVVVDRSMPGAFTRLMVSDPGTGESSKVELATDYRANQPVQLGVGPVLHPDDAVANKMCALFGRAQARDFIDVAAAFRAGYDRERLVALATGADPGFDRQIFAGALNEAARLPDSAFASYGVSDEDLVALRKWFADWRAELLAGG